MDIQSSRVFFVLVVITVAWVITVMIAKSPTAKINWQVRENSDDNHELAEGLGAVSISQQPRKRRIGYESADVGAKSLDAAALAKKSGKVSASQKPIKSRVGYEVAGGDNKSLDSTPLIEKSGTESVNQKPRKNRIGFGSADDGDKSPAVDKKPGTVLAGQKRTENRTGLLKSTKHHPDFSTVKKFVFFTGHGRSGSTIIGAITGAHPHVVMALEAKIFRTLVRQKTIKKESLYNLLYQLSVEDPRNILGNKKKGYTLKLPGLWQGQFDEYIEVIGDKAGGTDEYVANKKLFVAMYEKLKNALSIPIVVIYPVRNPFDVIATTTLYKLTNNRAAKASSYWWNNKTFDDSSRVQHEAELFFENAATTSEMIEQVFGRENVLEVHNCDLVDDPRASISEIFQFLGVDTSKKFLDACAAKIFKSVSRSRDLIKWSPELKEKIATEMKKYRSFDRYSFTSD